MLWAGALSVVLTALSAPANATMRIAEDRGGQIGHYLQAFAMLRSSGENVVIDGNCLSACTLVLGIIPRERLCATRRARFGFHAAWMPDVDGQPITSPLGTQALWDIYPTTVKRWIRRHGGLSRRMIYMQGRDLNGIVATCEVAPSRTHTASQARSKKRTVQSRSAANTRKSYRTRSTSRTVRYRSASATSYSR